MNKLVEHYLDKVNACNHIDNFNPFTSHYETPNYLKLKTMKFTQKIKDDWLTALKSGEYTQITGILTDCEGHCCIGVLGEITEGLSCNPNEGATSPYDFLVPNIGQNVMENIWRENDMLKKGVDKPDYSNVIPLIEELKITI
jgi:hypothetical protein